MGRKRRFTFALIATAQTAMLLLGPQAAVYAADTEQTASVDKFVRVESAREEQSIRLLEDSTVYEVRPGDCLWSIAEELWGDGSLYGDIVMSNREIISDADMIYPGTQLEIGNSITIPIQNPHGKVNMWSYEFYMPYGNTTGVMEFGENGANFCLSGDGRIACLVQDKTQELVRTVSDWEACQRRIEAYIRKNYKDRIDTLSFAHYQSEKGEDIYLYSCRYRMDLRAYGYDEVLYAYMCAGTKLTEHIQAEFIGFDMEEGIRDSVLYVTAGFEELEVGAYESVNSSNMAIWKEREWELDGMFNALTWVDGCLTYMTDEVLETPEDKKETMTSKYPK